MSLNEAHYMHPLLWISVSSFQIIFRFFTETRVIKKLSHALKLIRILRSLENASERKFSSNSRDSQLGYTFKSYHDRGLQTSNSMNIVELMSTRKTWVFVLNCITSVQFLFHQGIISCPCISSNLQLIHTHIRLQNKLKIGKIKFPIE